MRKELIIDGREARVEAEWIEGKLWLHMNGKTWVHEVESKQRARGAATGRAGDIMAPMPGKVTKVLRKAGDMLLKGDAVLVMEAMKMEYTLKAEGPGRVDSVHCQAGDQVTLGKILVKITPSAE